MEAHSLAYSHFNKHLMSTNKIQISTHSPLTQGKVNKPKNRIETDMSCHLIYETNNTAVQLEKNSLLNKCNCPSDKNKS